MITYEHLENWLNEYGISWENGENSGIWWLSLGSDTRAFRCALHLEGHWVFLLFRFADTPLTEKHSLYLLDLNDQLSIFKFFLDEKNRLCIGVHWPANFLTLETMGYLIHQLGQNVDYFFDHIQKLLEGDAPEKV